MQLGPVVRSRSVLLSQQLLRQFRLPPFSRGLTEVLLFALVFLAAGHVSLGHSVTEMLQPMLPIVLLMMVCMVCSSVYRRDIAHSMITVYCHSIYGFVLAGISLVVFVAWLAPAYNSAKFIFFFLFFGFFVINTMRPLISATDFMDSGGGRRRRVN